MGQWFVNFPHTLEEEERIKSKEKEVYEERHEYPLDNEWLEDVPLVRNKDSDGL